MNLEIERNMGIDYLKKFDYFLMGIVITISMFGLVFLNSAVSDYSSGSKTMLIQIIGLIIGFIASLIMTFFDYRGFKNFCWYFYFANIFVMCLVFVPKIGINVNGSRAWIKIAITTYQPSELMKLAMIVILARYLEKAKDEGFSLKYILIILGSFIFPVCIILLQKDFGMILVFTFIFIVMLMISTIKLRYVMGLIALGTAAMPFIFKFVLNNTRRERLLAFLDPEKYKYSYGRQLIQAMIAIGSGQMGGQGIGNGSLNNTPNAIPFKESDMIFSVICEEAGFIGALIFLTLMLIFLLRMLYISSKSRDMFGTYLGIGVFAMFSFIFFENICMNIGIMPITGLPLPFVSRGGSAMVTNYIAIGFILSISMRRRRGMFIDE